MISIELSDEEAHSFRMFREHQDDFMTLYDSGVFNVRNGNAIINFDPDGQLTSVNFNIVSYKKGFPVIFQLAKGSKL